MLNLLVMIDFGASWILILILWLFPILGQVQSGETPEITSPLPGQALQGVVVVNGHTALKNFQSTEVSYSYTSGSSWFLISQSRNAVEDGRLAVWDTTTITDGDYKLRVQVFLSSGSTATFTGAMRGESRSTVRFSTLPFSSVTSSSA